MVSFKMFCGARLPQSTLPWKSSLKKEMATSLYWPAILAYTKGCTYSYVFIAVLAQPHSELVRVLPVKLQEIISRCAERCIDLVVRNLVIVKPHPQIIGVYRRQNELLKSSYTFTCPNGRYP